MCYQYIVHDPLVPCIFNDATYVIARDLFEAMRPSMSLQLLAVYSARASRPIGQVRPWPYPNFKDHTHCTQPHPLMKLIIEVI